MLVKTEGTTTTRYVYGLGLIGQEEDGVFKTYHYDYRGSTVALTNLQGGVTDTFQYDTYGKLTARTGTTATPFMYNGRDGVMTDENGLVYMRARYYSPTLKRFINVDVVAGSITNAITLNRYAYANGNPVSNVDPFGLESENSDGWSMPNWLSKAIVVVAAAATITAATIMTVSTYGAGSVLGVAMISTAVTMLAKATEVSALQIKKGIDEGKSGEQIAKDTISSVYNNGEQIIGMLPLTKSAGVLYNDIVNVNSAHINNSSLISKITNSTRFNGKYSFYDTLGSKGGIMISAITTGWNVSNAVVSIISDNPIARAEERGYRLK